MPCSNYENDPNYWWLVLQYALRDGRTADADNARRQLDQLGIEVAFREGAVANLCKKTAGVPAS